MPEALQLLVGFALALGAAALAVPAAIRLALRTGFMDVPAGYKGHVRATPYLGGIAVVSAAAVPILLFGAETSRYAALLIWAIVLSVVGTIDDRRSLNPFARLAIEAFAGLALWHYGIGWSMFGSDAANIAVTIFWVVGLVNAFNLMDNMDGASASVTAIAACGAAAVAVIGGDVPLAIIVLAVAGASAGFLPYNLGQPSRIFLGDGGSMPLGLVVAGAVMAAPVAGAAHGGAILALAPIAGLPILDTTLVVVSRRRSGRAILSGGRDHLTHRLRSMLGSARMVALALGTIQAGLCLMAVLIAQTSLPAIAVMAGAYIAAGIAAIYTLESRVGVEVAQSANGAYGVVPGSTANAAPSQPIELAA